MVDAATLEYISNARRNGLSPDDIEKHLVAGGWTPAQAQEAIRDAQQSQVPVPPPPPPKPPVQTMTVKKPFKSNPNSPFSSILMIVLLASLLTLVQNGLLDILDKVAPFGRDYYSSQQYKKLLIANPEPPYPDYNTTEPAADTAYNDAVRIRSAILEADAKEYAIKHVGSTSKRLLATAALVLPFWLLTAGFYMALKEKFEKYRILLLPYYITSGWLLVYLLFNVSKYILDNNSTAGVYIVLVMLIAVLTGVVFAFQRYSHRNKIANP